MVYTKFNNGKPDIADNGATVIDNTRDNLEALRDAIVAGALVDWNMDINVGVGSAAEPDEIIYKNGTQWIRLDITWGTSGGADGSPTVIVYDYSANSGVLYETIGTATMTYDNTAGPTFGALTDITWS